MHSIVLACVENGIGFFQKGINDMRQLSLAFVSAFVLTTVFVATAAADSHLPAAPATTGATGATGVTAVPRAGVGEIAASMTDGVILLFIALAALMALASMMTWRRA
jgi:hypothetical protein